MRKIGWLIVLIIGLAVALAWRLPGLDQRPMHGDEANQAVRTGLLMDEGTYHYDPHDHHGPVLYFAALPFCKATAKTFADTTEWNFRLVPVAFSLFTLGLMGMLVFAKKEEHIFLNDAGLAAALLFTACSPAMVYYNRFFIQESQLVTFLTGMFVCALFALKSDTGKGKAGWAAGAGAFAALAMASKETVALSFAAAGLACLCLFGVKWVWKKITWKQWAWAIVAAIFVFALFFTSFFTYPKGLYDAVFSTVSSYLHRATEVPEHQHPWNFYLQILFWFKYGRAAVWSEALVLIPAVIAIRASWCHRSPFSGEWKNLVRFVTLYTVFLLIIYSAIPYKTPWCCLSVLHGFLILAGAGIGACVKAIPIKTHDRFATLRIPGYVFVVLLTAVIVYHDCTQSYRACFRYPADPRNPYVYAHTGMDAMNLVRTVREAAEKLRGRDTPIAVAVPPADTWPLPWYFRDFRRIGYWTCVKDIPEGADPSILIVAADQGDAADARFGKGKQANFFGIRPGALLNVFVPAEEN